MVLRAFSFLAPLCLFTSSLSAADTNPPPRLTVELRDGSRVVGESVDKYFKFRSALLGDLKLPVKEIRAVECTATNTAKLTTVNGDLLTVAFLNSEIPLKTSFGKVELAVNSVRNLAVSVSGGAEQTKIINVDFGSGGTRGFSLKKGPAAIGATAEDFWNFYDRDASSTSGDWRRSGTLSNLKLTNGDSTEVDLRVSNAPGAWNCNSDDPMYKTYIYPLDGGENTLTLQQLPEGQYDFLAYSPDGNCELAVGGTRLGSKRNDDSPKGGSPEWVEGVQYVRWQNVTVQAGQPLTLTVRRGTGNNAILSGIQIRSDALANLNPR